MTAPFDITTAPLLAAALAGSKRDEQPDTAWSALPDAPQRDDTHGTTHRGSPLRSLLRRLRLPRAARSRRAATPALR